MSYCKKLCNSNSMDVNVMLYMIANVVKLHRFRSEHYMYTLMHVHLSNVSRQTH